MRNKVIFIVPGIGVLLALVSAPAMLRELKTEPRREILEVSRAQVVQKQWKSYLSAYALLAVYVGAR